MSRPENDIRAYFLPRSGALWGWMGDGQGTFWIDGTTIAFRQELCEILACIARKGLPPFGAVVVLLAACREGWFERTRASGEGPAPVERFTPAPAGRTWPLVTQAAKVPYHTCKMLEQVLYGLDAVARLPEELRQRTAARAVLCEVVFENAAMELDGKSAGRAIRFLAKASAMELREPAPIAPGFTRESFDGAMFERELAALAAGLSRVDEESLALRIRTGLDRLVGAAEIDVPAGVRVRRLLGELKDDEELSGVARVAQNLMAAVSLPRAVSVPEELPLGGVSDLANRGPLDRLVLSELANDDLTLAARVALGEALYLRRESPAREVRHRRAILVDAGIRTWGVPRVYGTAVALALMAAAQKKCELAAYRAKGRTVEKIELGSREGLIAHLEALEPEPHPGGALAAFAEAAEADGEIDGQALEMVIVTQEEVLGDQEFLRALRESKCEECLVATVAADGNFALYAMSRMGRRKLSEARLDLEQLLVSARRKAATVPLVARKIGPQMPVIFAVEPFPLLLPCSVELKRTATSARHGLVGVSHDGRLLHWRNGAQGAWQLTDQIRRGRVGCLHIEEETGKVHVVTMRPKGTKMSLMTVDLASGKCTRHETTAQMPGGAWVRDGWLMLVYDFEVHAVSLATGQPLAKMRLPSAMEWLSTPFLSQGSHSYEVTYDGSEMRLDKIAPLEKGEPFHRPGFEGVWLLTPEADLIDPQGRRVGTKKPHHIEKPELIGVSPDGRHIVVRERRPFPAKLMLDFERLKWSPVFDDEIARTMAGEVIAWSTQCQIVPRWQFTEALVTRDGALGLYSDGCVHVFVLNGRGELVLANRGRIARGQLAWRHFEQSHPPRGARFKVRMAKWSDGSRAFLDSRGLLHLKSSDPDLPEMTLTLSNAPAAGWLSDGHTFGWRFFLPDGATIELELARMLILKFASRLT